MQRTLVFGDLHLTRETPEDAVDDVVSVISGHPGTRLVFVGDLFDLSADQPGVDRRKALAAAWGGQPRVTRALAEHVDRGGSLWLLGGNHDEAVGDPDERETSLAALGVRGGAASRVRTSPWFLRDGGLHVEHGHLFDPDNAASHPLMLGAKSLGVHFVEEFIAPTGAHRYLNANDAMPLRLLMSAFAWYGVRGPFVVYKYFDAAFRALFASGPFFREGAPDDCATQEVAFAEREELGVELVRELATLGAAPTMQSFGATFQRLYLDRVAATLTLAASAACLATGKRGAAASLFGVGALAMGASWALGYDRYGGSVPSLLEEGAAAIRDASGARLVVMGHAHRECLADGYANTGSFSFPKDAPGRPFLEIEGATDAPIAARRYFARRERTPR